MIEIDGSQGEGGGQILRTALSLSMCTGQSVRFHDIRARRPKPGLMRQHLACVDAAQTVSGGHTEGAEPGSTKLRFDPGPVRAGSYHFAVSTAGSCMLVLQTVLPALMLASDSSQIALSGGTHNPMAPTWHFISRVFTPILARLGVSLEGRLLRHGFYPAGGGQVEVNISPAQSGLTPFSLLERGALIESYAECLTPGLSSKVAKTELNLLGQLLGWDAPQLRHLPAKQHEGPGNALMVTLQHEHITELFASFGERGLSSKTVASNLAHEVQTYQASQAPVGPHLADQLTLPLALAVHNSGRACAYRATEITPHTRTNVDVIQRFLPVDIQIIPPGQPAEGARVEIRPR